MEKNQVAMWDMRKIDNNWTFSFGTTTTTILMAVLMMMCEPAHSVCECAHFLYHVSFRMGFSQCQEHIVKYKCFFFNDCVFCVHFLLRSSFHCLPIYFCCFHMSILFIFSARQKLPLFGFFPTRIFPSWLKIQKISRRKRSIQNNDKVLN